MPDSLRTQDEGLQARSFGKTLLIIPSLVGLLIGILLLIWKHWFTGSLGDVSGILLILVPFVVGVSISIAIRLLELTGLLRAYTIELNSRVLSSLRREFGQLTSLIENLSFANERMGQLEGVLRHEYQFSKISELASGWCGVLDYQEQVPRLSQIIGWRKERIEKSLDDIIAEFSELASGRVHIDDPVKELQLNNELLDLIAMKEMKAISYEEAEFWSSSVGKNYLLASKEFVTVKKGQIKRIFIEKSDDEYAGILKAHHDCGVQVRKIKVRDVPGDPSSWDFVIYDNAAVRLAKVRPKAIAKSNLILISVETIREKQIQFDTLWKVADDWRPEANSD